MGKEHGGKKQVQDLVRVSKTIVLAPDQIDGGAKEMPQAPAMAQWGQCQGCCQRPELLEYSVEITVASWS